MNIFITPSDMNFINLHFPIGKHDAEDLMSPQEALENFAAADDKVLAAYKIGLAIGAKKGSFGFSNKFMTDVPGH